MKYTKTIYVLVVALFAIGAGVVVWWFGYQQSAVTIDADNDIQAQIDRQQYVSEQLTQLPNIDESRTQEELMFVTFDSASSLDDFSIQIELIDIPTVATRDDYKQYTSDLIEYLQTGYVFSRDDLNAYSSDPESLIKAWEEGLIELRSLNSGVMLIEELLALETYDEKYAYVESQRSEIESRDSYGGIELRKLLVLDSLQANWEGVEEVASLLCLVDPLYCDQKDVVISVDGEWTSNARFDFAERPDTSTEGLEITTKAYPTEILVFELSQSGAVPSGPIVFPVMPSMETQQSYTVDVPVIAAQE